MTRCDTPGAIAPVLLVEGQAGRLERLLAELRAAGTAARLVRLDDTGAEPVRSIRMDASAATARALAHEVANYLLTIRTTAHELAAELPPDCDARGDLELIDGALESGDRFVAAIQSFVHPKPLGDGATDLSHLLRALETGMRRLMPSGPTLEVRAPAAPLLVRGSEERLRWLVLELVASAASLAGAAGHVTVSTADSEGGPTARLAVACDGRALPPDRVARIFEPFVADRSYDGGMRLPAIYAAVTAGGGAIDAESMPGGGLTLRVGLPLAGGQGAHPGGGA